MADADKIIPFKGKTVSSDGWGPDEHAAQAVAKCARMSLHEYEQTRAAVAKTLRVRVSFLDKEIKGIHNSIAHWYRHWEHSVDKEVDVDVGAPMDIEGQLCFVLCALVEKTGRLHTLAIEPNGNFTILEGVADLPSNGSEGA